MKQLTLDLNLLIKARDMKPGSEEVFKILDMHKEGKVQAYVSSRLFNPDSVKMDKDQINIIKSLLNKYGITIKGNSFRLGISALSGSDMLSGGKTLRTQEELDLFRKLVGDDPTKFPPTKTHSNKIGDYDALYEHYSQQRDVFLTFDTKQYFAISKRALYKQKLGLLILDPIEFYAEQLKNQNT